MNRPGRPIFKPVQVPRVSSSSEKCANHPVAMGRARLQDAMFLLSLEDRRPGNHTLVVQSPEVSSTSKEQ